MKFPFFFIIIIILYPPMESNISLMHQALDKCQLGDEVRKKEGKLDSTGIYISGYSGKVSNEVKLLKLVHL